MLSGSLISYSPDRQLEDSMMDALVDQDGTPKLLVAVAIVLHPRCCLEDLRKMSIPWDMKVQSH